MTSGSFKNVWEAIVRHTEEVFFTKKGLEFTYQIQGDVLETSRTKYKIHKGEFRKAFYMLPIPNPGKIRDKVRGYVYVWAILHDTRILSQKANKEVKLK